MDELHGTLYDTNCTMAENERMLSEYRDVTHSQSREMDIVSVVGCLCVHVHVCKCGTMHAKCYKYGYDSVCTQ